MLVMRIPVEAVLLAALTVACAQAPTKSAPPKPVESTLAVGTPVHLILLKQLESGVDDVGTSFPMMVSQDITDSSGNVLVPKGTSVEGRVTWSRREGTLGSLTQSPARLDYQLGPLKAVDGQTVGLCSNVKGETTFRFDRSNTGRIAESGKLEQIMSEPGGKEALQQVVDLFSSNAPSALTPDGQERLKKAIEELGLNDANNCVQKNQLNSVPTLMAELRNGASVAALASGGAATAVGAVTELADVCGQVQSRLGGMLHGRNILAFVGTPVDACTATSITIKLPPK